MSGHSVKAVTAMAQALGVSRPSASRSLHGLASQGLVAKNGTEWELTDAGKEVCSRMQFTLPSETAIAGRRLGQLLAQRELAATGHDLSNDSAVKLMQSIRILESSELARVAQRTEYFTSLAMGPTPAAEVLARMSTAIMGITNSTEEALKQYRGSMLRWDVISGNIAEQYKGMMKGFSGLDFGPDTSSKIAMFGDTLDVAQRISGALPSMLEHFSAGEPEVSKAARALMGIETGISSILQAQKFSLSAFESIRRPDFAYHDIAATVGAALGTANLSMGEMLARMSWIEGMGDQIADARAMMLLPHLGPISKSYGELFHETLTRYEPVMAGRLPAMISVSAAATADYVRGVGFAVADDAEISSEENYGSAGPAWSENGDFEKHLTRLDSRFVDKLHGAWAALGSDNPDRIAQAAHSGRELLSQALERMAPDDQFTADEVRQYGQKNQITRRMRVSKIIAKRSHSAVDWSDSVATAISDSYSSLSAIAHSREMLPSRKVQETRALLRCLEGWLWYLMAFHEEN